MSKSEQISIAFQGETEPIEFSSDFSTLEKNIKNKTKIKSFFFFILKSL